MLDRQLCPQHYANPTTESEIVADLIFTYVCSLSPIQENPSPGASNGLASRRKQPNTFNDDA